MLNRQCKLTRLGEHTWRPEERAQLSVEYPQLQPLASIYLSLFVFLDFCEWFTLLGRPVQGLIPPLFPELLVLFVSLFLCAILILLCSFSRHSPVFFFFSLPPFSKRWHIPIYGLSPRGPSPSALVREIGAQDFWWTAKGLPRLSKTLQDTPLNRRQDQLGAPLTRWSLQGDVDQPVMPLHSALFHVFCCFSSRRVWTNL